MLNPLVDRCSFYQENTSNQSGLTGGPWLYQSQDAPAGLLLLFFAFGILPSFIHTVPCLANYNLCLFLLHRESWKQPPAVRRNGGAFLPMMQRRISLLDMCMHLFLQSGLTLTREQSARGCSARAYEWIWNATGLGPKERPADFSIFDCNSRALPPISDVQRKTIWCLD